jgi:hypothetical protein
MSGGWDKQLKQPYAAYKPPRTHSGVWRGAAAVGFGSALGFYIVGLLYHHDSPLAALGIGIAYSVLIGAMKSYRLGRRDRRS